MKIYIYTLKDPDTQEVRYVGKSKRPKRRLSEHTYKKLLKTKKTHLAYWVLSLLKNGKKPIMEIVDETNEDWQTLEQKWIKKFSNLCNHTEGGEGCHGYKQPPEHKEKRRQSMFGKNKGKKHTQKFKDNLSSLQKNNTKLKGVNNGRCHYTQEQINEVKKLLKEGIMCKVCIARYLGVNRNLVYEISYNKKHRDEIPF
mgnify:CR=1 FL=1